MRKHARRFRSRARWLPAIFRSAPDPVVFPLHGGQRPSTTSASKRRSVCIALLLFIRDLCMKLGAVILTRDFNKGAEREAASSGLSDQRRISPLEAAFSHANIPWPTSGVTPLWGPSGVRHNGTWPESCGFVVLPGSQPQWLILRHGSINVVLASIGLRTTDRTWHCEQWLHPKFAGRKRRRDGSPADSKSRQKIYLVPSRILPCGQCR